MATIVGKHSVEALYTYDNLHDRDTSTVLVDADHKLTMAVQGRRAAGYRVGVHHGIFGEGSSDTLKRVWLADGSRIWWCGVDGGWHPLGTEHTGINTFS